MKISLICLLGALVYLAEITPTKAQEAFNSDASVQLRIPFHLQYLSELKLNNGDVRLGIAGWAIMPSVLMKENHTASTFLCGPLFEHSKGSWIEIMAGALRNDDGYVDPLIDMRFLEKRIPKLILSGELAYFPKEERRRIYSFIAAETPVNIGTYTMRVGLESENILSLAGKKDSFGVGPRIVFPLPKKLLPFFTTSVVVGYEFRTDRDFLRGLVTFTYHSPQKEK